MVNLIISGGQTGADLGGLKAGKRLDIPTGGFMPKGFKNETGFHPEYAELYGMNEWETNDYLDRTKQNVRVSDATVIFGRRSPGSNRTEEFCRVLHKECIWMAMTTAKPYRKANVNTLRIWLSRKMVETLNVAGNRESVSPGIEAYVEEFMVEVLTRKEK